MAEYIEREAFYKILENWRDAHAFVDDSYGCGLIEDVMCELKAQTAADVVEVVRCKDCVSHGNCFTEDTFNIVRIENPYCCGGKRRDDHVDM